MRSAWRSASAPISRERPAQCDHAERSVCHDPRCALPRCSTHRKACRARRPKAYRSLPGTQRCRLLCGREARRHQYAPVAATPGHRDFSGVAGKGSTNVARDEVLAPQAHPRSWFAQGASRPKAGGQFTTQGAAALDEERLVDGFVADAHRLVIREVHGQAPGDLFRAPGPCPSPILSRAVSSSLPTTPLVSGPGCRNRCVRCRRASLPHRSATLRSRQASSPWDDGQIVRRATGQRSRGNPDRRSAWSHCAGPHAISWRRNAPDDARSPAGCDPGRAAARCPHAPPMTGICLIAASPRA